MSSPYIWSGLQRATTDPTTIDEAISEAIIAHGDDPDAHLGTDQSLQSHRASEIIDHLAESVVNDKISAVARAYKAIVGSGQAGDYTTIQAAIPFVTANGGGTILLMPGSYYLSGQVEIPANVNLYAQDSESVTIYGDYTAGDYFTITDDTAAGQNIQVFQNINFINSSDGIFYTEATDLTYVINCRYINCSFTGGGRYIYAENQNITFQTCGLTISNSPAVETQYTTIYEDTSVTRHSTSSTCYLNNFHTSDLSTNKMIVRNSNFNAAGSTTCEYYRDGGEGRIFVYNSTILNWSSEVSGMYWGDMIQSYVQCRSNNNIDFNTDGENYSVAQNTIFVSGSGHVVANFNGISFNGNLITDNYSSIDNTVNIYADRNVGAFNIVSAGSAAVDLAAYEAVQQSPNSTRTVTTTVPRAGSRRTLIILTSGTTTYMLTFGTGFKTTGTLATGATSARRFIMQFISDGTYLIECSRTTAIT